MKLLRKFRRIHGHLVLALLGFMLAEPSLVKIAVGGGIVMVGLLIRVWAAGVLEKNGPLCIDGPYRYVRHPLYLGSFVAAVGFAVMMNVMWGWILILPLFVVLYAAQVVSEERHLRSLYGPAHAEFASAVPAIIPWPGRSTAGNGCHWTLVRMLKNCEHYHVVFTLLIAAMFLVKTSFT